MDIVELKSFLETLIYHERELREKGELNAADALKLQAVEYERRLDDLNHAHAEAQRILYTYATRESVDQRFQERDKMFQAYKDATDKALTLREGTDTGKALSKTALLSTIGAVATGLGIIVVLANYFS